MQTAVQVFYLIQVTPKCSAATVTQAQKLGLDRSSGFDPTDPEPLPDHASRGALEFDQSLSA